MMIDFSNPLCKSATNKKLFGLCDNPAPAKNPAYIDEQDGTKWIAVVNNEYQYAVSFTAIDNCIEIKRPDGTMEKRCDGLLAYNSSLIFVELKERGAKGNAWVKDAEAQLRATISNFEAQEHDAVYTRKRAYIANSEHPKFKGSQMNRMEQFSEDTGYVLRIENRITLD